jgi:hypothetical protein
VIKLFKNGNKNLYINGDIELTEFNASIVLESKKTETLREILSWVRVLQNTFDFIEDIYNEICWILKKVWASYRDLFNSWRWESVTLAAMLYSHDHYHRDLNQDFYTFVEKNFKEDSDKVLIDTNHALIRLQDNIYLKPFRYI